MWRACLTHELNQEWFSFPIWLELHNNIHVFVNSISSLHTLEEDAPKKSLVLKGKHGFMLFLEFCHIYFCSFSNRLWLSLVEFASHSSPNMKCRNAFSQDTFSKCQFVSPRLDLNHTFLSHTFMLTSLWTALHLFDNRKYFSWCKNTV